MLTADRCYGQVYAYASVVFVSPQSGTFRDLHASKSV